MDGFVPYSHCHMLSPLHTLSYGQHRCGWALTQPRWPLRNRFDLWRGQADLMSVWALTSLPRALAPVASCPSSVHLHGPSLMSARVWSSHESSWPLMSASPLAPTLAGGCAVNLLFHEKERGGRRWTRRTLEPHLNNANGSKIAICPLSLHPSNQT
jgi:hypothetical protein